MPNSSKGFATIMRTERGFAPVIAIVAVVVVLALAGGGFFALGKMGKTSGLPGVGGVPSLTGLTLNPNCEYNDPELCKFMNNWKEQKNYTVKSLSADKEGKVESLMELAGDNLFHQMMTQNGKEMFNMIVIKDITYTKDLSDNKWWKQKAEKPKELDNETVFQVEEKSETGKEIKDQTTYKSLGKEGCGKLQCFKYEVINPDNKEGTEYLWFDDKEYLLRKVRNEGKDGSYSESEYSYDKVSISEPSPIKEAAQGQLIVPGMSEQESRELQQQQKEAEQQLKSYQQEMAPDYTSEESTEYSE
jgi:hypothetical protein